MKGKNGFIATSLIYSFFLVFIAVIAALLNGYVMDKLIFEQFSEEVAKELNDKYHVVTFYSKNSDIKKGMILTNLISNGDFSLGKDYWTNVGNADYSFMRDGNFTFLQKTQNSIISNSYLKQNIYLLAENVYYYKVKYNHTCSSINKSPLMTYIDKLDSLYIDMPCTINNDVFVSKSQLYKKDNTDNNKDFILGNSSDGYSGISKITEVMLLNLTASFGKGYEPNQAWLDDNIDYFDGTVSFFREDKLKSGSNVSIRTEPKTGFINHNTICKDELNRSVDYEINRKFDDVVGTYYYELKVKNINSDVVCTSNWSM